ncbi:MAG: MarR family transcriptional regulator [Eubacteriaceae bacterium]|nr:MarR family transcriptional regulator [Eubacteriaceae bacterium]
MEDTRWEEILSTLFPPNENLRIICANGSESILIDSLAALGHSVVEINVSEDMASTRSNFEDESYDAIVCINVLSSLPDDRVAWSEFKRILKKEGHAVIFDSGRITVEQAQAQGFSHCRFLDFDGMNCMSARKPMKDEQLAAPQIALFHKHLQTAKKQLQLYQNWCQGIGMPYSQYTVLNLVSRHPRGIRPSDISSALVIPPQTLTRILAVLQNVGYVDRKANRRDQRSSFLTITETGAEKIKPLQEQLREIEKKALAAFKPEDLAVLSGLSDMLLAALEDVFDIDNRL